MKLTVGKDMKNVLITTRALDQCFATTFSRHYFGTLFFLPHQPYHINLSDQRFRLLLVRRPHKSNTLKNEKKENGEKQSNFFFEFRLQRKKKSYCFWEKYIEAN